MKGWRYCGWVFPGEVTWLCARGHWLIGGWWEWSEKLECKVDSFCIFGFCFERPL